MRFIVANNMERNLVNWLIIWCFGIGFGYGQSPEKPPMVSNIRVESSPQQVIIRYDVENLTLKDSVFIQIEGRLRGLLKVRTLSGDAGLGVTSGPNKIVVWDYLRDGETLDEEIQAKVNIKPFSKPGPAVKKAKAEKDSPTTTEQQVIGGGPTNALLSALLPGLGNIMVQPKHSIGLRPLISVAYVGALAYGLLQKGKSNDQYALYLQQPYDRLAVPYYNEANSLNHRYVLAVSAAAVIWVADVTYTLLKGIKNEQRRKNQPIGMRPTMSVVGKTPTFGLRYQF
jgi:hypothetical protein